MSRYEQLFSVCSPVIGVRLSRLSSGDPSAGVSHLQIIDALGGRWCRRLEIGIPFLTRWRTGR